MGTDFIASWLPKWLRFVTFAPSRVRSGSGAKGSVIGVQGYLAMGAAILVGPTLTTLAAQEQPREPSFAVASIRAHHGAERLTNRFHLGHGGSFTAANCSLALLVNYAYQVFSFQVTGAPGWLKTEGYDIIAKAEGDPPLRDFPSMVRRLLEDRFKLKSHWQIKEVVAYQLVVSKAGGLKESESGDCPDFLSDSPTSGSSDAPCAELRNTPGHTKGYKLTTADLAGGLSFFLQRPVLDKTGLTGKYDIELQWTPERVQMQATPPPDSGPPSIFTALREQLGLKLESTKTPVKALVIDHVERPSEN